MNDGIFEYLEQIEDTSLIVVSNYDNDSPQNYALGLIAGHAYSVEDFEGTINFYSIFIKILYLVINGTKIVKLRNPWGAGEWKGDWGDDWIIANANSKLRNINSEQKRKLDVDNLLKGTDDEDGMFWMAWTDFVREFEALTVCHLEDSRDIGKPNESFYMNHCNDLYLQNKGSLEHSNMMEKPARKTSLIWA